MKVYILKLKNKKKYIYMGQKSTWIRGKDSPLVTEHIEMATLFTEVGLQRALVHCNELTNLDVMAVEYELTELKTQSLKAVKKKLGWK